MSLRRSLAACVLSIAVAACAIRPLPEDVTGYSTVQIVAKVRCEVRDAIRAAVIHELMLPEKLKLYPRYVELAGLLERGTLPWKGLRAYLKSYAVDRDTMKRFEDYNQAVIGYEFTFDIEEKNITAGGVDVLGGLSNGTVKLGLSAASDLIRGNNRTFRILDNFETLAVGLEEEYCGEDYYVNQQSEQYRNPVYPIAGSLKLGELIRTFLALAHKGNLVGMSDTGADKEIPTLIDVMEFTTRLTGGATPRIELLPRRSFSPVNAFVAHANTREDIHRIRVVVKLPTEEWIPRTASERRIVVTGGVVLVNNSPRTRTTDIKVLVAQELAAQPGRELVEATIKARNRIGNVVLELWCPTAAHSAGRSPRRSAAARGARRSATGLPAAPR